MVLDRSYTAPCEPRGALLQAYSSKECHFEARVSFSNYFHESTCGFLEFFFLIKKMHKSHVIFVKVSLDII